MIYQQRYEHRYDNEFFKVGEELNARKNRIVIGGSIYFMEAIQGRIITKE